MSTRKNQESQGLVSVTSVARARLLRAHRGFEEFVSPMLALCTKYPQLRIAGADVKQTLATLRAYEALAADEAAAEAQLAHVKDTRLQQSAAVWAMVLEVYARAQVFARTDPTLKRAIADFEAFMKQAPKKKTSSTTATGSAA